MPNYIIKYILVTDTYSKSWLAHMKIFKWKFVIKGHH